jgi:hypothetical protein
MYNVSAKGVLKGAAILDYSHGGYLPFAPNTYHAIETKIKITI